MSTEMENQRVTKQMARFVVMYDTPSDYRGVRTSLSRGSYSAGQEASRPAALQGQPRCDAGDRRARLPAAMLEWDDMESQGAALNSEAGNKTAEDAITNLSRYTTIRGMIVQHDDK